MELGLLQPFMACFGWRTLPAHQLGDVISTRPQAWKGGIGRREPRHSCQRTMNGSGGMMKRSWRTAFTAATSLSWGTLHYSVLRWSWDGHPACISDLRSTTDNIIPHLAPGAEGYVNLQEKQTHEGKAFFAVCKLFSFSFPCDHSVLVGRYLWLSHGRILRFSQESTKCRCWWKACDECDGCDGCDGCNECD